MHDPEEKPERHVWARPLPQPKPKRVVRRMRMTLRSHAYCHMCGVAFDWEGSQADLAKPILCEICR